MHDIKAFLAGLTHHPGVYQMLDDKAQVIYVGKAKDLKKRVSSYFSNKVKDPKTLSLVKQIKDIHITIAHSESEAVILECNLIKKIRPRYNILLRDDKSYPYILITNQHPYPRIDLYRGSRKKNALYYGPYPNAQAVRETISLLQKLFRLRTCRDHYFDARTRPCLLYQIDRCTGPCVNLISKEEYAHHVQMAILFLEGKSDEVIEVLQRHMETAANACHYELAAQYRNQVSRLRQMQDKQYANVAGGDADIIGLAIQSGMACIHLLSIRHGQILGSRSYFPNLPLYSEANAVLSAFLTQHYLADVTLIENIPKQIIVSDQLEDQDLIEAALLQQAKHQVDIQHAVRSEKRKWLNMAMASAKQALATHLFEKLHVSERLSALQQVLNLKKLPERIECFDVSHSMGEATVASCVVFDQNGPLKSHYRRFNITNITPGDDVAAMRQVVSRRFKRLQDAGAALPQVVFIDGGLTQLKAARDAMQALAIEDILLVGVAKGPERKPGYESLFIGSQAPIHLPSDSLALHFIQQIRDEAHRFAITGHRQQRDKVRRHSMLESIEGIGTKRRRDLLRYFGGIQGVARASLDELMKVPGISRSIAERIFAALHDTTL